MIHEKFNEPVHLPAISAIKSREGVGLPKLEEEQKVEIEASAHICCKASDSNDDDQEALAYLKETGSFDFDVVGDRRFNFENFETAHIRESECLKYWFAELGPI